MARMTEVRFRNIDDWVVEWHRHQAKVDGRSLENELRQVITDAVLNKRKIADEMRRDSRNCLKVRDICGQPKSSVRTGIVADDRGRCQCSCQVVFARDWDRGRV